MRRDPTQVTRIVKLFAFVVAAAMVNDIFSKVVAVELKIDTCDSGSPSEKIECLTGKLAESARRLADNVNTQYQAVRHTLSPEKRAEIERLQKKVADSLNSNSFVTSRLKAVERAKKQAQEKILNIAEEALDLISQVSEKGACRDKVVKEINKPLMDAWKKLDLAREKCFSAIQSSNNVDEINKRVSDFQNQFNSFKNIMSEVTRRCGFQR